MKDIMPSIDTDDGLFHDGDPTTGELGTIASAKWFNDDQGAVQDIQQEIKNVLADAGFKPDASKKNQLQQSIEKMISSGITAGVKDGSLKQKGIVQLSSATDSDSETLAATPKAVKAAYDRAADAGLGVGPVNKADAYSNIGQIYRISATAKNKPPAVSGNVSAGVMCLPMDAAPSAGYFAVVGGNMAAYVGFSQDASDSITWSRLYTDKYPPTADDINAVKKTGDTMTGALNVDAKISLSDGLEIGNQKAPSPAYIDFHTDGKATDYNARIISPQGSTELQLIAAGNANNGSGIIRMLGHKADQLSFALQGTAHSALALRKWGSAERPTVLELDIDGGIWLISVDHGKDNKAALGVNGTVNAEILNAGNYVQVGSAKMATDGNIWGTRWNSSGGWLWDAIVSQIHNIGQMSVSGNQWWVKINLNGGTLILQGGRAVGSVGDDGVTDRVGLNISVPNRLLHVSMNIKNFAQGYDSGWNPQVGDLSNERDGFYWLHGTKDRDIYWFAVGY